MGQLKLRELVIIKDPCFYQYIEKKELLEMNTSELTIALKILRKEQRRLTEKCYRWGKKKKNEAEELDLLNLRLIKKYRNDLEQILFDKQGFIPKAITDNMIQELKKKHRLTLKKAKHNRENSKSRD